ncbi:MAG TPA: hypothetical protein PKC28_14410 [Bdellovibrionales bacterium]|nr:hypothetical protein [Bdellovibrionales bacterium]
MKMESRIGFHVVHFGLTICLALLVLLTFGCSKPEEESKTDFGPEVSGVVIDRALGKAIQGATLNDIALGQYVEYHVNRRIEQEETTITLGATRVEVVSREDTADAVKFTLRITRSTRLTADAEFETTVSEEPLILKKVSLQGVGRLSAAKLSEEARAKAKPVRVTYHRLKEFSRTEAVPKRAGERADCGGMTPCSMVVNYLQFDMVQWYDDGSTQKVSLDFGFSTQTPFLPFGPDGSFDQLSGLMVLDCRSTYVPIEKRTVYLRDCQTLEDLQK